MLCVVFDVAEYFIIILTRTNWNKPQSRIRQEMQEQAEGSSGGGTRVEMTSMTRTISLARREGNETRV